MGDELLVKLCGQIRLESADPTWQGLLHCGPFAFADRKIVRFLELLTQNNPRTANFSTLLEMITSNISNSVAQNRYNSDNYMGLGMLHLCLLVMAHFTATLNSQQIRAQLFLPTEWPFVNANVLISNIGSSTISGKTIVESLIAALTSAVAIPHTASITGKYYILKLYCVDILLCLCSLPLHGKESNEEAKSSIFMRYLYFRGDNNTLESETVLKRGSSVQTLQSAPLATNFNPSGPSTFAVNLVRALLANALIDYSQTFVASATAAVAPNSPEAIIESFYSVFGEASDETAKDAAEGTINYFFRGFFSFWNSDILSQVLGSPKASNGLEERPAGGQGKGGNPLSERCLSLLLLLLHSNRSGGATNSFRKVFYLLHDDSIDDAVNDDNDGQGDLEMMISKGQGAFVDRIHFDFRDLILGLTRALPSESGVLLLYSFLQSHPTFVDTLACTGSVKFVLCPCLQALYTLSSFKKGSGGERAVRRLTINHLYVLSICILLIVQDSSLLPQLCGPKGTNSAIFSLGSGSSTKSSKAFNGDVHLNWYKERSLLKASLLDVCILCMLRTSLHAVFNLQDAYLLSNCAAVLNNIASSSAFSGGLHPHTCERLVRISQQLSRRVIKASKAEGDAGNIALVEELLVVLLKFMQSALRPRLLLTNVHLLYALIHDYEELVQLFLHPALLKLFCAEEDEVEAAKETRENSSRDRSIIAGDEESSRSRATSKVTFSLSHGLVIMVKHYLDVLDVLTVDHYLFSASQAIDLLKRTIATRGAEEVFLHCFRGCAPQLADSEGSFSYSYQEVECPEDFFVPYIWEATLSQSPELPFRYYRTDR